MGSKITIISGTDYNINGIQELGEINKDGRAYVLTFNKFGFISIAFSKKETIVRRHLSDCEDVRGMIIGYDFKNLIYKNNRWVVIHDGKEFDSQDVYVVSSYENGVRMYECRSTENGARNHDVTKAWFTFDKMQAKKYANRLSIVHMKPFEAVNVEDVVTLQHFE